MTDEIAKLQQEIAKLKAAIKWVMNYEAYYSAAAGQWIDPGCGCCSSRVDPPTDVAATLLDNR